MKLTKVNLEDLKPFEDNPRINEKAIDVVAKSLEKNGWNTAILIDQNNVICAGHTRYLAAKKLGMKFAYCYKKKMSKAKFIAYNIADNKTQELANWDEEIKSQLMLEISESDKSMLEATGHTDNELKKIILEMEKNDVDVETYTRAKPGEKSKVKMVQLFYDEITYAKMLELFENLQPKLEGEDVSDTVFKAVEFYWKKLKGMK